jgi:hypothetical protein
MSDNQLSVLLIQIMKGVLYAEDNPALWQELLNLQAPLRDYLKVLNLSLVISEEEGFAWLITKESDDPDEKALPKLIGKRQLSYPVSLLLALFRQKLVENDAGNAQERLVMDKEDIIEMLRVFFSESSNDAKFVKQVDSHLNKIIELGFLRRLRGDESKFEVKRIIKAFIDAKWLSELDKRLQEYLEYGNTQNEESQ